MKVKVDLYYKLPGNRLILISILPMITNNIRKLEYDLISPL